MSAWLAHIRRHPIKSIGGEALASACLQAARRLQGDREWAVLTEAGARHAGDGGEPDHWLPKSCFMRGVAALPLQAISGGWHGEQIVLTHPDLPKLRFDPATDGQALLDWLHPLWPSEAPAPVRLVRGPGIWTDKQWPWVSILSLSSLADLERQTGQTFGTDRWRGNLWIGGWDAFTEADMIGQIFQIGDVELRVTDRIGRCDATSADTTTGRADIDMVATLNRLYGSHHFGIYAEVVSGGTIAIGDDITS